MLRLFWQLTFGVATSLQFFRVTTLIHQLLFWSSYFFRAATFSEESLSQYGHSFVVIIFSEFLLFQNFYFFRVKLLLSSHFLRKANSLGQLLFGKATSSTEELFRIKISTEELLSRSRYFRTGSTFSEELRLEKANLSEK